MFFVLLRYIGDGFRVHVSSCSITIYLLLINYLDTTQKYHNHSLAHTHKKKEREKFKEIKNMILFFLLFYIVVVVVGKKSKSSMKTKMITFLIIQQQQQKK